MVCGDSSRMADVVGMRPNLYFTGSTAGTSLQECFKSDLKLVPKLPTDLKHEMMASARVKDDSRTTSGRGHLLVDTHVKVFHCHATLRIWPSFLLICCLPGLDQPGMEPIDWSVWDQRTFEEIIHRFRPRAVVLLTASCPSLVAPLLESQTPCLAVCTLPESIISQFLFGLMSLA